MNASPPSPQVTLNACTIVSKNYLCYARVLARSFLDAVPDGRFYVLLVDRNDGHVDAEAEIFDLIEVEELDNIDDVRSFLFKYSILEANTAVKPFFLEWLIERDGLANLVYFDPDILITGSLDELASLVARHSIVLTPHLTDPIEDQRFPTEQAILQAGANNLGFVALRATDTTRRLLRWWQDRLYDRCVVRIDEGLFVDQKWMDLAFGLFGADGEVTVHVDPGYNVAYWNLHGRTLERTGAKVTDVRVNGRPLVFFHFSGIDPESLAPVSKHQDRFTFSELDAATQDLYRHYADLVRAAGYAETRPWPYAFGTFSDGTRIPDLARALFLDMARAERKRFGDPFDAACEQSFLRWLREPAGSGRRDGHLSRLMARIHAGRPDLRGAYPDPGGADFPAFSSWMRDAGRYEYRLDDAFLADLHDDRHLPRWTPAGLKRRAIGRARRIYHSATGRKLKTSLKNAIGPDRTRVLKRRFRPRPVADEPVVLGPALEHLGVNLVGYLDAESGMGQAARSLARAFATTGIPTWTRTLDLNVVARREEALDTEPDPAARDFPYDVNLFVVNADQVPPVREHLGDEVFRGRHNVGLWLWEQDSFPDAWRRSFEPLDEVWTPSTFCVDAISTVSPVPVRRMPLPVAPAESEGDAAADAELRRRLDWPDDAFVFLFVFNYLSYFERKNPLGVVEAFRRAFGDDASKRLLIKTSQHDFAPDRHAALHQAIGDAPNVRTVDDYLSRRDVDGLMRSCDAYVSLHRSEGYGLTLAEAMYHGKPVVATPYSGNTDFFDLNNGFPVRYDLVTLDEAAGPYARGSRWAEPDLDHAAEQLRRVADDADARRRVGQRASRDVRERLSLQAVGRILQQRFDEAVLRARRRAPMRLPH